MKKLMCLLIILAAASMSMATVAPVTSVVVTDVPGTPYAQKVLKSITVGADVYGTLLTGTTTQGTALVPRLDDLDLNTAITGFGSAVTQTVLFGGANYVSINGAKPDFFLFEGTATAGNPETCSVAAIFPDGTVGAFVALPNNLTTWGLTGLLIAGNVNNNQRITGVCFDITDLKTAAGVNLTANAVIKGIAIGPTGTGIDPCGLFAAGRTPAKGEATTPVPANYNAQANAGTLTQVTWSAPVDPNIVSVTGYDVRFGTNPEPNSLTPTLTSTPSLPVSLNAATTYYWCVDTYVTWNSTGFPPVVKGPVWQFTTLTPALTFKNVITTLDINPDAALSATVAGFKNPISSVTFTSLTAGAAVTDTTIDKQTPKAELTVTDGGVDPFKIYQVKLVVSDGISTVEKIADVKVYVNACAAKKAAPGGWTANVFDRDGNCFVDLKDFAVMAQNWLDDRTLKAASSYAKTVDVLELDIQVECEDAYAPADPNYVTEAPLEIGNGQPQISLNAVASGGKMIAWYNQGAFLTYQVVVPESGNYTLYLRTWQEWNRQVKFDYVTAVSPDGDPSNDTLVSMVPTWNIYAQAAGAKFYLWTTPVTLTAGTHLIRITRMDQYGLDLDLFGFKKIN